MVLQDRRSITRNVRYIPENWIAVEENMHICVCVCVFIISILYYYYDYILHAASLPLLIVEVNIHRIPHKRSTDRVGWP